MPHSATGMLRDNVLKMVIDGRKAPTATISLCAMTYEPPPTWTVDYLSPAAHSGSQFSAIGRSRGSIFTGVA